MSSNATRQRILDATQRLIEREGLARITTKEVAREANCAEGTLFKHFGRKEDLCLAVVLENAPKFREDLARVKAGEGLLSTNLRKIGVAALQFFRQLLPLAVSLFADADILARHRAALQGPGRGPADVFELVTRYVSSEQKLGRMAAGASPTAVAALLLGACFHRAFIRQTMGKDLFAGTDEDFVASIVDTLIVGWSAKKGRK